MVFGGLGAIAGLAALAAASPPGSSGPRDALAAPAAREASPLRVRAWDTSDGLPQNSVNGMALGPRGFLWLATFGGLARFDGVGFRRWAVREGLRFPRVVSLAIAPSGEVWLGHQSGRLTSFSPEDETFESLDPLPPALAGPIVELVFADEGLLARTREGAVLAPLEEGTEVTQARALVAAALGTWRLGTRQLLQRFDADGALVASHRLPWPAHSLGVDREGRPWVVHRGGLARLSEGGRLEAVAELPPGRAAAGPVFDRDGGVWLGVDARLVWLEPRPDGFAVHGQPLSHDVKAILPDPRGGVWAGTMGGGLVRAEPSPFQALLRGVHLDSGAAGVLRDGAGGYWVADKCGGAKRFEGARLVETRFEGGCLTAIAREPEAGILWAAVEGHLLGIDPAGRRLAPTLPEGLVPVVLFVDGAGRLWVGGRRGRLLVGRSGGLREVPSPLREQVGVIAQGPDGALWVGGRDRIAVRGAGGNWRILGEKAGVPPGVVRAVAFDEEAIWVGSYGGGLSLLRGGEARGFGDEEGLPDAFIAHIALDGRGRVWFNGNRGAFTVPRADFFDVWAGRRAAIRARVLGTPESEIGYPSGDFDGRILTLLAVSGLVRIDVEAQLDPVASPPVFVESATLDGAPIRPDGLSILRPGPGALKVDLSAPTLAWPALTRFQHRMDGGPWSRPAPARQVRFESLAPGPHQLEVRALAPGAPPGPAAQVAFRLQPPLWARTPVRVAGLILGGVLVFSALRWRRGAEERRAGRLEDEAQRRRRLDDGRREREQYFRELFEGSPHAQLVTGTGGAVVDLNPAAARLIGGRRGEIVGRNLSELLRPPDAAAGTGRQVLQRLDGPRAVVRVASCPLGSAKDLHVHALYREDLERPEPALGAGEVLGSLAGGLAERVADPDLAARLRRLARWSLEGPGEGDMVAAARRVQASRAGAVSGPLRGESADPASTPPVAVEWALPRTALPVAVCTPHLVELLEELLDNACGAGARTVQVHLARRGGWGQVVIEDDGAGMPEAVRARLGRAFPLDTPPGAGPSVGLGWTGIRALVDRAEGRVQISVAPRAGTRVSLQLPLRGVRAARLRRRAVEAARGR